MSVTTKSLSLAAALALALGAAACSSSDESTTSTGSGGTSAPSGTAGGSSGTTESAAGDCENAIEIVNADAEEVDGLTDGEVDIVTAWSDEGPHPDNSVESDDHNMEFALASFEIEKDPQFGYSIPVGVPEVPDDEFYLSISIYSEDVIAEGMTFVEETTTGTTLSAPDGEINFISVYWGPDRLLPGDVELTITEMTDDYVCGTLESTTDTSLQTFVGVEGTFKVDRIQALEAEEDES